MFSPYEFLDTLDLSDKYIGIPDGANTNIQDIIDLLPPNRRQFICTDDIHVHIQPLEWIYKLYEYDEEESYTMQDIERILRTNPKKYYEMEERATIINYLTLSVRGSYVYPNEAINPHLPNEIRQCAKPLIAIKINLSYPDTGGCHANMLVIDKVNQTYERFDPGSEAGPANVYINEWFENEFRVLAGLDYYQYIAPMYICVLGPQDVSERFAPETHEGFCQTWVYLYLWARLMNPALPTRYIGVILLAVDNPKKLWSYVNKFIHFMIVTKGWTIIPQ